MVLGHLPTRYHYSQTIAHQDHDPKNQLPTIETNTYTVGICRGGEISRYD